MAMCGIYVLCGHYGRQVQTPGGWGGGTWEPYSLVGTHAHSAFVSIAGDEANMCTAIQKRDLLGPPSQISTEWAGK